MTNPHRFDAMLATSTAYGDAVTAGFLPLADQVEFALHNVDHVTFLAVADRYGAEIKIHDADPDHQWVSLDVPLYAAPDVFKARLRLYSGTITSLGHLYPIAHEAFMGECADHNRTCLAKEAPDHKEDACAAPNGDDVGFIPAGLNDTSEN